MDFCSFNVGVWGKGSVMEELLVHVADVEKSGLMRKRVREWKVK